MKQKSLRSQEVTFGIRVPNSGPLASPASIVKVAKEAESLGFDSVWVHDHLTWTEEIHRTHISSGSDEALKANENPDFYEALTTLSYLAGLVDSVRIGIACLMLPCRNPLFIAKQVATLDVLCGGRLDLGVGIGSPATIKSREYEVFGVNRRLRGKICDDYVGAMKRTAKLGEGWLPAWLTPEDIAPRYQEVKEMARQFGRDGDAIHLGIEVYASIDENSSKAKKNALGTFQASRGTYEREMTLEYLESVSLIGSPDEIREKIRAYAGAGVSHFEIKFIYPTMDRHLEMMKLLDR